MLGPGLNCQYEGDAKSTPLERRCLALHNGKSHYYKIGLPICQRVKLNVNIFGIC